MKTDRLEFVIKSGRILRMLGFVGLIFFLGPLNLCAEEQLGGFYNSSDESGIWYMTVQDTGKCTGVGWSDKYKDVFSLTGTLADNHLNFDIGGYSFSGLLSRETGLVNGGWSDIFTKETGRLTGSLVDPDKMKVYAGEFSGSYSGETDSGTWTALLFTDGHCEGEFRSNSASFDEPALEINGGFNASGQLVWEAGSGSKRYAMKGEVSQAGYLNGEWHDSQSRTSGTFSGERENALPAEVVNPTTESDSNDFCFIRTACGD
ncbi:MAG: hypothetical protein ACOZF0_06440 [Thermodesulfobacteriota bacterium]